MSSKSGGPLTFETDDALAFEVLERALEGVAARHDKNLVPINFKVGGSMWSFDPKRVRALIEPREAKDAPLTLELTAAVLLRLLLEKELDVASIAGSIDFSGDPGALLPFIAALSAPRHDPLSIRGSKQ